MPIKRRQFNTFTGAAALAPWTLARAQGTLASLYEAA